MKNGDPRNQPSTGNTIESTSGQLTVSEAADTIGVDSFTILGLIQRGKINPTRSPSGEIVVPKSELVRLTRERPVIHAQTQRSSWLRSVVPGSTVRLTRQLNAYTAAFEAISPEFDELRQMQRQVRQLPHINLEPPSGSS